MQNDPTERLNEDYAASYTAEDNTVAFAAGLPQTDPLIIEKMAFAYLAWTLQEYIMFRGIRFDWSEIARTVRLMPKTFGKAFLVAVTMTELHLTPADVESMRGWLKQKHPELYDDVVAHQASVDNSVASPAFEENVKSLFDEIQRQKKEKEGSEE